MHVQKAVQGQEARKTRKNTQQTRKGRQPAKQMCVIRLRAPRNGRVSTSYLALVVAYPIHPIRSDEDLGEAIGVIDKLLARKKPLDPQEQDYLDSLSHEVERYEAEAHPMPAVSDAAMLRHLIEARDVKLSEVAEVTGIALSTLSSVLTGKRQINRNHIEKLAPYFGVEAGVFLN
jgi:HTH-type transcriptional regulator / antitoxin HigA